MYVNADETAMQQCTNKGYQIRKHDSSITARLSLRNKVLHCITKSKPVFQMVLSFCFYDGILFRNNNNNNKVKYLILYLG